MSLIVKAGNVMHSQYGWYISDSWTDAPVGSWGTKDQDLFERLGDLKTVDQGVPDPVTHTIKRKPGWFMENGVSGGDWKVGAADPTGMSTITTTLHFSGKFSIACYLADFTETQMDNIDHIGPALADLYRKPGKAWKLSQKWVYTAWTVGSGFILMNQEKDSTITLTAKGIVPAGQLPVKVDVTGIQKSASNAAEVLSLDGVTPFLKLGEVYDPILSRAWWRQIG